MLWKRGLRTAPEDFLSFDKNNSESPLLDLYVPESRRSSNLWPRQQPATTAAWTGVTEEIRIAGLMLN